MAGGWGGVTLYFLKIPGTNRLSRPTLRAPLGWMGRGGEGGEGGDILEKSVLR